MTINPMKFKTVEENREYLRQLSESEKRGFEAASEGQLIPDRSNPPLDEEYVAELHEEVERQRTRRTINDRRDEEAVDWQNRAFANARDVEAKAREDAKPKRVRKASSDEAEVVVPDDNTLRAPRSRRHEAEKENQKG